MSSDVFTIPWTGTVTNAGGDSDFWEVLPNDDRPLRLLGIILGQTSEVSDAAEENLSFSIIRLPATVTSGSGGTSPTARCVSTTGVSAPFTVEANNTTVATTSGTSETLENFGWNERNTPFEKWYPEPDIQYGWVQTEALVIRMLSTPADDFTFTGTLWVRAL